MKTKKIYIVTDLGGGDGGKGGVVHKLCVDKNPHTVIKIGGAQGSHGVRTAAGQSFNFSQFGCGTFEGVRTHISDLMIVDPYSLSREAKLLQYEWGIRNIFDYLSIDENALCVTPFHRIASRLHELARKDNPKGTIGIGAGETVLSDERNPELSIRVRDLSSSNLGEILKSVRAQKIKELENITNNLHDLWPDDQESAQTLTELLFDEGFIARIVDEFRNLSSKARIVNTDYLKKNILDRDGTIIVESSHGILTDRYYGFHPHVSRLRTTPKRIIQLLQTNEYDGEIIRLGVTRAYQIRHGAGPMVTESEELLKKLLPGSSKEENRWQGKVRVGALDLVTLRYAIAVCGGPENFDGLAITWFDQIQTTGEWQLCYRYQEATDRSFFSDTGEIKVRHGTDAQQSERQERLGQLLNACQPEIVSHPIDKNAKREHLMRFCADLLTKELKIPVKMVSFGPTENDKINILN